MAGGKSTYLKGAILDHILGATIWTPPSVVYVALATFGWSDFNTGSSFGEVSGAGYTRVAVTNNTTNWPLAVSGAKGNATVFTFPTATAVWGTIESFSILDASTAGNVLFGADLTTNRSITTGDTPSFAIGALSFLESQAA